MFNQLRFFMVKSERDQIYIIMKKKKCFWGFGFAQLFLFQLFYSFSHLIQFSFKNLVTKIFMVQTTAVL